MATVLKVFAAFLAGLVIVMGGALMHSRAHEFGQPIHAQPSLAPAGTSPAAVRMPEQQPAQNPAEAAVHEPGANPPPVPAAAPSNDDSAQAERSATSLPVPAAAPTVPATNHSPQIEAPNAPDTQVAASNGWPVTSAALQNPSSSSGAALRSATPPVLSGTVHAPAQQTPAPQVQFVPQTPQYIPIERPAPAPPIPPEPKTKVITVQPGTQITVRLAETLTTDRNRTGDTFRATLAAPLMANGYVVAGSGAPVLGRVTNAHRAPVLGGRADLTLAITNVETKSGGMIPVDTSIWEQKGAHSNIVNTAKMATGAAVGAVVGAVTGAAEGAGVISGVQEHDRTDGFMATKRSVVLPAGTPIVFTVATPFTVTDRPDSR